MSVRTPYLASSLGHAVALGLLLTVSALQKPAPMVPNVRIVTLPGGGRPGPKSTAAAPVVPKAGPVAAPKVEVPPAPEPPKPKAKAPEKTAEKTPPPKPAAKPADAKGTLPPQKRDIVSKGPVTAPAKTPPVPAAAAAAAAAGGDGARDPSPARGVGVEAEGDPGPLSGYLGLLRDKVAANWAPPLAAARRGEVRAVVAFTVGREGGAPRDLVVAQPSGDGNFDLSALRAVARANPLPPFPSNYAGDAVVIRFTFFQEY